MKHNRLMQLLFDNRQTALAQPLAVRALSGDEAEIRLYAPIVDDAIEAEYWGGVAPEPFLDELKGITASTIHLRINSPGGSVFGARAIETGLREHSARIVVHIDSLAASAASFIAMAGDEIIMSKGAMIMIHKAWTLAWGNSDDLEHTAALLKKIDGTLVDTYVDRSKQAADKVADWMKAETWFTSAEAIEFGFADKVANGEPAAKAAWNLSAYAKAPSRADARTVAGLPPARP